MPNILTLAADAVGQPQRQILHGQVSASQPAPTSFASPLYVVVPGWSQDHFLTVTNWPACHGTALPAPGADVLLIKDDQGNLRCAWWSAATVFSLAALGIARGTGSLTFSSSATATGIVSHSLGRTPVSVVATFDTAISGASVDLTVGHFTSSQFTAMAISASGLITGTFTFYWVAYA